MRNANRPSGPGKPTQERRDAAVEAEEMVEAAEEAASEDAASADAARDARQAERDAHVKSKDSNVADGTSRDARRESVGDASPDTGRS